MALAAGVIYVWDNWAALKERITDWAWWKNALINMAQWLLKTLVKALDMVLAPIRKLAEFIGLPVDTLNNAIGPLIDKMDKWKSKTNEYEHEFGSFGDSIKNAMNKGMNAIGLFQDKMGGLGGTMKKTKEAAIDFVSAFSGMGKLDTIGGFEKLTSGKVSTELAKINQNTKASASSMKDFVDSLKQGSPIFNRLQEAAVTASMVIKHAVVDMASTFISGLAQMAVAGESIKGVFSGVLDTLAGLMERLGRMAIAVGIGIKGIKEALKSLNPVAAIAAGAALLALAGVVRAGAQSMAETGKSGQEIQKRIPGKATGGPVTKSGAYWVGERGPEIVHLDRGNHVTPNNAITSRPADNNINITLDWVQRGENLHAVVKEVERKKGNTI
jgi:hypothetical protein